MDNSYLYCIAFHNWINSGICSKYLFYWYVLYYITGINIDILCIVFEPVYPSYLAQFIKVWTSLDNALLFGVHAFLSLVIIRFYFSWIANEKYTNEFLLQPPG